MNKTQEDIIAQMITKLKSKKSSDSRVTNKGRPRVGMDISEVEIVRKMRHHNFSLKSIFNEMRANNLTRYKNYGTFNTAWKNHKAFN